MNAYLLPDSIAVEADWCDRWEEVLMWCRKHVNSESYQTEFSKFSQREISRFAGTVQLKFNVPCQTIRPDLTVDELQINS